MQLEELQMQWSRLDEKLDRALALNAELVRRVLIQPAHRRVNRLAIWPALDVAFCVAVLLLGALFLRERLRDSHLLAPAAVVMAGAVALLVSSIRQLQRVADLDWTGPVAGIQSALEKLRVARLQQFKWVMLLSPLVGFCGLMVGLHWLVAWATAGRINILDRLDPAWMAANYAFGILFVPLGHRLAGIIARRCGERSWWRSMLDGISGASLKAAAQDVERWASLGREDSQVGG